jgi:hypothetical protein
MKLKRIEITICEACLAGEGEECHTPGCALMLHSVSLPIDSLLYDELDTIEIDGDGMVIDK